MLDLMPHLPAAVRKHITRIGHLLHVPGLDLLGTVNTSYNFKRDAQSLACGRAGVFTRVQRT